MLNLLFISDSPKVAQVKNVLQPVLKVIIDIVPDFDHGLKDVFEKRPATVCIQDQISGVTGESVARHIQMLLGTSAPTFILIHDGSSKAKQIKGLFEYVVDLSLPGPKLSEEFQHILKVVVGDQWEKIFIPPVQTPASIKASPALSQESQEDADKLVDDFLADLETTGFSVDKTASSPRGESEKTEQPVVVNNSADELAEMLLEQSNKARQDAISAEKPQPVTIEQEYKNKSAAKPLSQAKPADGMASSQSAASDTSSKAVRSKPAASKPKQSATPANDKAVDLPPTAVKGGGAAKTAPVPPLQPPQVAPSEFRIIGEKSTVGEQIPTDLLQAFEENYRSESNSMKQRLAVVIVLLILVAAGGWYYFTENRDGLAKSKQPAPQAVKQVQVPAAAPTAPTALPVTPPATSGQKPAQTAAQKPPVPAVPALPSFIPKDGHDKSFAASKPGWERYIGRQLEFRVFISGDKVKVVQVLASQGNVIPENFVKSILTEFAGSPEYQISSKENKSGFLVLRGSIAQKADILLYKKGSAVRAFVVSLN